MKKTGVNREAGSGEPSLLMGERMPSACSAFIYTVSTGTSWRV